MPLQRRLPKRGFRNAFKKEYALVNLRDLARFPAGSLVEPEMLRESAIIREAKDGVKVLGNGELPHALTVRVNRMSKAAREKIEASGGRVELV
jgi:large subunit ribosomal protein L15